MDKPAVTGVQHVGIGVRDIEASRTFYRDVIECTEQWADFGMAFNMMPDFFRASPHSFNGWMYQQKREAIVVECIQRFEPAPRPIHKQVRFGDIGVNKMTIEVSNVDEFAKAYIDRITFLCEPKSADIPGLGDYRFIFGADPDGNLMEFVSSSKFQVDSTIGTIRSLGISVTELDRSIEFYQKYVDFDTVVIQPHESFSGLVGEVSGSTDTQVRSCLLANSNGFHMLELYEVSQPKGRSIPFHVLWGDYGYLEAAYLTGDVLGLANYYIEEGLEFISYPTAIELSEGDIQGTGWFLYVRDPDGIPVEVVMVPEG